MSEQDGAGAGRQFVYRLSGHAANFTSHRSAGFSLVTTPLGVLRCLRALARELGWRGVVRTMAKLVTPRRLFFVVVHEGEVAHHGWVMIGRCRYYAVEPNAAVVGPVETNPAFRGRGLATVGLAAVVAAMAARGIRIVYIDTADTNLPMQRVIEKCGFGKPIASYPRPDKGLQAGDR